METTINTRTCYTLALMAADRDKQYLHLRKVALALYRREPEHGQEAAFRKLPLFMLAAGMRETLGKQEYKRRILQHYQRYLELTQGRY